MGVIEPTTSQVLLHDHTSLRRNKLVVLPSGNVGIGTTGPLYTLDVNGNARASSLTLTSASQDWGIYRDSGTGFLLFRGYQSTYSGFLFTVDSTREVMRIDNSGNVGIGTTGPGQKLDVNGNSVVARAASSASLSQAIIYDEGSTNSVTLLKRGSAATGNLGLPAGSGEITNYGTGSFGIISSVASGYLAFGTGGTASSNERMRIDSSGNVGIGTTSPGVNLDVAGLNYPEINLGDYQDVVGSSAFRFKKSRGVTVGSLVSTQTGDYLGTVVSSGVTSDNALFRPAAQIQFEQDAVSTTAQVPGRITFWTSSNAGMAEAVRIDKSGNVGIGTTGPLKKLDIYDSNKTIAADDYNFLIRTSDAQAIDKGGSLAFGGWNNTSASTVQAFGAIAGRKENGTTGDTAGYLQFATRPASSGNMTERVRIDSSGNVGIGTTSPGAILDVYKASGGYIQMTSDNPFLGLNSTGTGLDDIRFYGSGSSASGPRGLLRYNLSTDAMQFTTAAAATPDMTIKSGNVGIGTTVPTNILSLGSEAARTFWVERRNTTNNAGSNLVIEAGGSTNGMVSTVAVVAAGNGYNVADVLTLATPSGGTAATCTVATLTGGAGSGVATVTVTTKGAKYTTGTKATTVAPAGGTGCTIGVSTIESGTDKAGGTLYLDGGLSSGSGLSAVEVRTCPAGASSATDNTLTTIIKASGNTLGFFSVTPVVQQTGIAAQKTNYTTGDLDTEAEIISALNTTNTAINALRTTLNNLGFTTIV